MRIHQNRCLNSKENEPVTNFECLSVKLRMLNYTEQWVLLSPYILCAIMTTELGQRTARIAYNVYLKWYPFVTPDPFVNSALRVRRICLSTLVEKVNGKILLYAVF